MKRALTIIISPSGKFYGSEQTLNTFLKNTLNNYIVYVNINDGSLIKVLNSFNAHKVIAFNSCWLLYLKIFFSLLISKIYCVYINEAGHIRYAKLLAKIFRKVRFVVHVRLVEDTTKERLGELPGNVSLISVSKYIDELIRKSIGIKTKIISSPIRELGDPIKWESFTSINNPLRIAIIGRVTASKGITYLLSLFKEFEEKSINNFDFHFYGDIEHSNPSVKEFLDYCKATKCFHVNFHGYQNRSEIYEKIDIVLHLNKSEPHGVIFLEALSKGRPFIGFNKGGIGNIASNIGIGDIMIQDKVDWIGSLIRLLKDIQINQSRYEQAYRNMLKIYSISGYVKMVESLILDEN